MKSITMEHRLAVADWLDRGGGGTIGGEKMAYDQLVIDCGTACCAAGALSLAAGLGHANSAIFDRILESLAEQGVCGMVAAGLCGTTDNHVGPILAALLRDDLEEAERRGLRVIREDCEITDGFAVVLDGAPKIKMTGGVVRTYGDSAPVISKIGGVVHRHGSVNS